MILHALDPSLRTAGLAEFRNGTLSHVHLVRNPEKVLRGAKAWARMATALASCQQSAPSVFVFELMQVYEKKGGGRKEDYVDPADLVEVVGSAAWCAAASGAFEHHCYLPAEWKGSIPKKVHNKWILNALTPAERAVVEACDCPPHLLNNVIDSVGIGLFHLGRMGGAVVRAGKRR